ncbi:hypothetical protein FOA52_011263 [Chlamydomonas sp. UWO 241]|nr:hypothetical protein FOA52_011263 [Chlamydomonas sp. UWO 241]
MSAPVVGGPPARVRIKGRWPSVMRFFVISVGFMMTWILIQSELHYYATWFGPQILLELNFAFYLPSIPVLLISGLVERHLDKKYGPTRSMFLRLTVGLGGTAILAAAFPFIAGTHSGLLIIVAALGSLSAIAFSASYQLVQWFRHADIIGLGLGQVGCGPLVLLIQLGLEQFNAWPHRWQWIAMFEVTAAMVLVALLAELSLFAQVFRTASSKSCWSFGTERVPARDFVLSIPVARGANWFLAGGGRRMDEEEATAAAAERIAAAAEDGTSLPVRLATDVVRFLYGGTGRREPADGGVVSASLLNAKPAVGGIGVEPRGGGVLRVLFTVASDAVADTVVRWRHELRRCVDSTAVFDVLSDREEAQHQALWPAFLAAKVAGKRAQFHRARLVVDGERYWGVLTGSVSYEEVKAAMEAAEAAAEAELVPPEDMAEEEQLAMTLAPAQGFFLNADPMTGGAFPGLLLGPSLSPTASNSPGLRTHSSMPSSVRNSTPAAISRRARADGRAGAGAPASADATTTATLSASADASTSGSTHGGLSAQLEAEQVADAADADAADAAAAVAAAAAAADVASKATVVVASPFADAPHAHTVAAAVAAAGTSAAVPADPFDFGDGGVQAAAPQAMTWAQETSATLSATWSVLVAFFVSVGTMYLVFPFFTYVPSSGIFGDHLARTLFFTRIGCDICGRFSPRMKSLVTRSPRVLAMISALQVQQQQQQPRHFLHLLIAAHDAPPWGALATISACQVHMAFAALFIAYIKYMPPAYRSDWLPLGAVTFLWLSAGYMNTCCNIVAPSLVPDHLTGRCSGLMALAFQIAHFAGLVLCAVLEVLLFSGGMPHGER